MSIFRYKIVNKNGYSEDGIIDANSKQEAINKLKVDGFLIQKIKQDFYFSKGISIDDLIQFFVHILFQLKCNISFYKSLFSYVCLSNNSRMKAVIYRLIEEIQRGNSIFKAFKIEEKYFGKMIPLLLQTANSSGKLIEIIENIIHYLEMRKNIKNKIKKALFYPTIILIVSLMSALFCLNFLGPQIKEISRGVFTDNIPFTTRICFELIPNFDSNEIYIKISIIFALLLFLFLKKIRHISCTILRKIPVIKNIMNEIFEWYFCSIADISFNSNLTVFQFINLICEIDDKNINKKGSKIKQYILSGIKLSVALKELEFLSPTTLLAIKVGEESNKLKKSFRYLSEEKNKQIGLFISKIGIKLGVFITLFTSLILLFLVIGLFSPLYDYMGFINE